MKESGTNSYTELSYGTEDVAHDDDAALVRSSQKGDLEAFERLVMKHQKRMLNIAYRMVGNYDDACEVVQDGFVSAYKSIKKFRGEARFTTWLTTITLNLAKNRLKQMKSLRGHVPVSLDDTVETADGEMTVDPPSNEPSALEQMEKRDVQRRVQNCIQALAPDFREVLVLRDLQDFSYDDIGVMLKTAGGTVKSRLFRAREMVRDCLKRVMGEL